MRAPSLMRRVRMLGLAVMAVFALAAIVASGASAAPEWKGCVKAEPKNSGKYTDKLCTSESPTAEGKYELVPSVGNGKGFKGKGGTTTLHVVIPADDPPNVEIKCASSKDTGKVGLPNLVKEVVILFKGCKVDSAPCQSGSKTGVIVTNSLAGEMVDTEESEPGVGTLLEAEAGPGAPLATFKCTGVAVTNLLGSVIAVHSGNVGVISKAWHDDFYVGAGLGEIEGEGKFGPVKYTPLVNVPTHKTGGVPGEHFLLSEIAEVQTDKPEGTYPSGLEAVMNEKGEALMIAP